MSLSFDTTFLHQYLLPCFSYCCFVFTSIFTALHSFFKFYPPVSFPIHDHFHLMQVFHTSTKWWSSLGPEWCKTPQLFAPLISIIADLNKCGGLERFNLPPNFFFLGGGIVSTIPTMVGIIVTFMSHSFSVRWEELGTYPVFFSFNFTQERWNSVVDKFLLTIIRSGLNWGIFFNLKIISVTT